MPATHTPGDDSQVSGDSETFVPAYFVSPEQNQRSILFRAPHFDSNGRTTPSGKKKGANVLFLVLFHVNVEETDCPGFSKKKPMRRYFDTTRISCEPISYCRNRAQLPQWQERRSRQLPALPVMTHRYFYTRRIFFKPVSYPQKKARGQLRLWPERRSCQLPTPPVMTRRYLATVRLSFQPISYRQNKTRARSCFGQPHFDSNG